MAPAVSPGKSLLNTLELAGTTVPTITPTRITATSAPVLILLPFLIQSIALKRSLARVDLNKLGQNIKTIQLNDDPLSTPNDLLTEFQNLFTFILDQVAPLKPIPRLKKKAHWMNPHIKALMRHRDFLARKVQQTSTCADDLKLMKKIVKSNVRRVFKTHGSKMLTDGDMRSA